jgi:hypothetical protein
MLDEHDKRDLRELFNDGLEFETSCEELGLEDIADIEEARQLWNTLKYAGE